MKTVLSWIVVLGLMGGGGAFGMQRYKHAVAQRSYDTKVAALKRDFLKQSVGLRLLEPDRYRQEIGILLTQYFAELDKLQRELPEFFDVERERKVTAAEMEKGRLNDEKRQAREERIDITLDLFNRMRSGQYRPLYTSADKTFRFDIYDIAPAKSAAETRVKLSYVHAGAFGPVEYKLIQGNIRATQVKGKPMAIPQIVGEGQPPSLQIDPEKWVAEFPPGMEIGYYELPQFPREAEAIELTFDFSIRTTGGSEIESHILFPDVPIPESWKLPEGQVWQAEERIADESEIRAVTGAAPKVR